jgi:hypothetical protein
MDAPRQAGLMTLGASIWAVQAEGIPEGGYYADDR